MGNALQIRVSVVTWNPDLLEKLWPRITELAFSLPNPPEKHGVLELTRALNEALQYMDWPAQRKERLGPDIREAARLKKELEAALADWKASEANRISDQLEEALTRLEEKFTV